MTTDNTGNPLSSISRRSALLLGLSVSAGLAGCAGPDNGADSPRRPGSRLVDRTVLPFRADITQKLRDIHPATFEAIDGAVDYLTGLNKGQARVLLTLWASCTGGFEPNTRVYEPGGDTFGWYGMFMLTPDAIQSGALAKFGIANLDDSLDAGKACKAAARIYATSVPECDQPNLNSLNSLIESTVAIECATPSLRFMDFAREGLISGPRLSTTKEVGCSISL